MVAETETAEEVQAPADAPQVEEAAPVEVEASVPETETVPESGGEQGELDTPAEEPVEPPTVELSRRDKALEEYADIFADERNTAAQLREQELRTKSGTREATAEKLKAIRERLRTDPQADVDEDLNFLDDSNSANATARSLAELTTGLSEMYEATPDEQAALTAAAVTGNLNTVAAATLSMAARSKGRAWALEQDAEELATAYPDTPYAKSFRALRERSDAEAVQAVTLEKNAEASPGKRPATPANGAPSGPSTYDDVSWVRDQMAQDDGWLNKLSSDGETTNLQRARPAIDRLATERKKQRAS